MAKHEKHQPGPAAAAGGHGAAHEDHGIKRYVLIWAILLVLTAVTVYTGKATENIYIAMGIASIKATLVVLFFMHLWEEGGVNRLIFVTSLVFAVVLMVGVFGDLLTRAPGALPNGGPLPHSADLLEHAAAHEGAHE